MKRFCKHLTFSNLMAIIAVFVALGGTSYAAIVVTGKNVKDGSLTGRDVRDGSLAGRDVADRSLSGRNVRREGLTGNEVRNGTLRAGDLAAGTLPVGGDVVIFQGRDRRNLDSGGSVTVASITLPAGRWLVNASGMVESPGQEHRVQCFVRHSARSFADTGGMLLSEDDLAAEGESFALTGAADIPNPDTVELQCDGSSGDVAGPSSLTATRVESVDDRSAP